MIFKNKVCLDATYKALGSAISGNLGSIFGKNFLYATRQPMVALRLDSVTYYSFSAHGNPLPLCTHRNPHNSVSVKIEKSLWAPPSAKSWIRHCASALRHLSHLHLKLLHIKMHCCSRFNFGISCCSSKLQSTVAYGDPTGCIVLMFIFRSMNTGHK